MILQECLAHAGAEVQLPLQLADLFLPVTRALYKGQLRSPAHVLLSPCTSVPIGRLLRFLCLSFVMKRCVSATLTRDEYWRVPVATDTIFGTLFIIIRSDLVLKFRLCSGPLTFLDSSCYYMSSGSCCRVGCHHQSCSLYIHPAPLPHLHLFQDYTHHPHHPPVGMEWNPTWPSS